MKAAYFIAQEKNAERFTAFFEREGIFLTAFSADDIRKLTAFIQRDKTIAQQNYVVIDVGTVKTWSIDHILNAVQNLRRFTTARLVFLGEPCEDLTELYGALANVHRVDCLIIDDGSVDVEAELRKCLVGKEPLPDRMQAIQQMMAQQTAQAAKPLMIPPGLVIHVAVAGTMPRCGVTTQVFAIYHYLKSLGFHPAIWDKLGRLLEALQEYERFELKDNGVITIRSVDFCTSELPQYDAYVIDYGELTPEKEALFRGADMSVLVGCTKPWEMRALGAAIHMLLGKPCEHLVTLASFSAPGALDKLARHLGKYYGVAPYAPDFWQAPEDAAVYAGTILPALKEICGMQRRVAPELEVG